MIIKMYSSHYFPKKKNKEKDAYPIFYFEYPSFLQIQYMHFFSDYP